MKFLIVSDTHGDDDSLRKLYKQYPNMDYYLHAGDSQSSSMAIYPFDSVEGNCDFYSFDRVRRIRTNRGDVLMKHFPHMNTLESKNVKFFIHGHTHRYELYVENAVITMCPGSLTLPRDGTEGTYILMDISDDHIKIDIIEVESKKILTSLSL